MRGTIVVRAGAALGIGALVALLLPTGLPVADNPYTRLHTLRAVPADNDYRQWVDMIRFLQSRNRTQVITDPVTSYLVRAATHHLAWGYKFHEAAVPLDRDAGYYARYPGSLMVVNRRDGGLSHNGARAGHWPPDVLLVSQYYPESLEGVIQDHPRQFRLLWEHDRIRIYEIEPEQELEP